MCLFDVGHDKLEEVDHNPESDATRTHCVPDAARAQEPSVKSGTVPKLGVATCADSQQNL